VLIVSSTAYHDTIVTFTAFPSIPTYLGSYPGTFMPRYFNTYMHASFNEYILANGTHTLFCRLEAAQAIAYVDQ